MSWLRTSNLFVQFACSGHEVPKLSFLVKKVAQHFCSDNKTTGRRKNVCSVKKRSETKNKASIDFDEKKNWLAAGF